MAQCHAAAIARPQFAWTGPIGAGEMIPCVDRERVERNQHPFSRRAVPADVPGAQGGCHLFTDDVVSAVAVGRAEGVYGPALVDQLSDHSP